MITPTNDLLVLILRRIQGHRSIRKQQHSAWELPEAERAQATIVARHGLMTAECTCGAKFRAPDGPFGIHDFVRWERTHARPASWAPADWPD